MRTALLRGCDHTHLGAVECVAEGPAAIALSMGGAVKAYEHTDPNEDAVGFALGSGGALAAVGDAHRGCAASALAIDSLLLERAAEWTGPRARDPAGWRAEAVEALWAAHMAVRRGASEADRQGSRTTLALALARFADGHLFWASIGDSHVFRLDERATADLASAGRPCAPRYFLGSESLGRPELAERLVAGSQALDELRAVVLATDGISERGVGLVDPDLVLHEIGRAAGEAPLALRPLETARELVERANAAHTQNPSGDNVAVAALWLERGE